MILSLTLVSILCGVFEQSVNSRAVTVLRCIGCNIVTVMAATAWLMLSFSYCIVCGFGSYTVLVKCYRGRNFLWGHLKSIVHESNPHTIQELKDNISHAVAAIRITVLQRVYLNMVTARLLTNCSHTLRRQNITRTRAKGKAGYFFVAHPIFRDYISIFVIQV